MYLYVKGKQTESSKKLKGIGGPYPKLLIHVLPAYTYHIEKVLSDSLYPTYHRERQGPKKREDTSE